MSDRRGSSRGRDALADAEVREWAASGACRPEAVVTAALREFFALDLDAQVAAVVEVVEEDQAHARAHVALEAMKRRWGPVLAAVRHDGATATHDQRGEKEADRGNG